MVWHDGPSVNPIALSIEREEGFFDEPGDGLRLQPARAVPVIQKLVAQAFGMPRALQAPQSLFGQAIGQSKRDELGHVL